MGARGRMVWGVAVTGDARYEVRDFVVFLPGIMGSTLSRDGVLVWGPSAGAALRAVRTFGGSLRQLRLPEGVGDDHPDDGVEPVAVMPDLHVLPGLWTVQLGYERLLNWLESTFGLIRVEADGPPGNFLAVPYDWRLSNRYNGRRLKAVVEPALERWRGRGGSYADARVIFICHSMGGLVARWYIQREGGAEVTRKLVTLGTPHRGALNSLEQLVNGVQKGPWPFRVNLTEFAQSMPAAYQLLPEYACLESGGGLAKTTEVDVPELSTAMAADAMRFHEQLDDLANPSWGAGFDMHPVQGQNQQTATTARLSGGRVISSPVIEGRDEGGDATVPALSAVPKAVSPASPVLRHVTERHGALQANRSVFDEIEGILTASEVVHRAPTELPVDVRVADVFDPGEELAVEAAFHDGGAAPLEALLVDEAGATVDRERLTRRADGYGAVFGSPPPGAYQVRVVGYGAARAEVAPVTAGVLVWGQP
jgi:pimeloyl-ACP methyl ester carboxylesterase